MKFEPSIDIVEVVTKDLSIEQRIGFLKGVSRGFILDAALVAMIKTLVKNKIDDIDAEFTETPVDADFNEV